MKINASIKTDENSESHKPRPFNNTPLSYKELDLITSIQGEIEGRICIPFLDFFSPIFHVSVEEHKKHVAAIWSYTNIAMHLLLKEDRHDANVEAASIYLIEAQRLLGALFQLHDAFWKTFYLRQEKPDDRGLIALDAIYHLSKEKDQLSYEFSIQAVRAIVAAHYSEDSAALDHLAKAQKIASRLTSETLNMWIANEIENRKTTIT